MGAIYVESGASEHVQALGSATREAHPAHERGHAGLFGISGFEHRRGSGDTQAMDDHLPVPEDVLYVDAGDNADWLRGYSWDLPIDVDEFLACIGVGSDWSILRARAEVFRFTRLRVADAMPASLRMAIRRRLW
jgi:hypothetical protein